MPAGGGPFFIFELAQALARLPGRLEFDHEESRRIGQDMFERFERGDFREHEVLVQYRDPSRFIPARDAMADARNQGRPWEIDPNLWYVGVALTYPAAKRYIECCGLTGAQRLLDEWFTSPTSVRSSDQKPETRGALTAASAQPHRVQPRRKTGPDPSRRLATEAAMKEDIAAGTLTIEALEKFKEVAMASKYGVSRDTARKARRSVLSELGGQEPQQFSTTDK